MTGNKYDNNDLRHITEGTYDERLHKQAIHAGHPGQLPVFRRYIVLDVIHDPAAIDKAKLGYYQHTLGVSNIEAASVAPRNSIIARPVLQPGSSASDKVMVLYPLFPPHLAMPAKPGEHVWVMFENPDAAAHEMAYWMCRVTQPSFVEDVNYTHADRQLDAAWLPGLSDVFEGSDEPVYDFPNGATSKSSDGQRYQIANTISLPDPDHPDTAYSTLLSDSDAGKISTYEPVPRYRKRPADVAFEGSNNTLIVLGTDRTTAASDYVDDPDRGKIPKTFEDDVQGEAGAIDLVVGRGQTPDTGGKPVTNDPLANKELGKDKKNLQPKEGDVDLKNDRSRILIAQKTKVDKNFKIDAVVKVHSTNPSKIEDGDGEGVVVVKTDKIRFIARHDVVILVSGASEKDDNGNVKDPDPDPDKCASVIIRANGDIIFTPAKTGLLRFGGDDADLVPLCTRVGTQTYVNGKGPIVPDDVGPIVDTMAGVQGKADGLNGTFPTKVLFK